MKTKFYKRLVPIALIASMAVTNVGITSASAAEAATIIEQSVGNVFVGAGLADVASASDVCGSIDAVSVVADQNLEITGNNTTVTLNLMDFYSEKYYPLSADNANDAKFYAITDSSDNAVDWISVSTLADNDAPDDGTATPKYAVLTLSVTTKPGSETTLKLKGAKSFNNKATPKTEWVDLGTFKVHPKSSSGSNPVVTTPVAAGDGFQIPGGLGKDKSGKVSGYAVGVTEVKTSGDASEKLTLLSSITSASQLAPSLKISGTAVTYADRANLADHYVVWYNASGKYDAATNVYVKVLTDDEKNALPKGDKLTNASITTYKDKDTDTVKQATDQYKIEHSTATVDASGYSGFKTMAELFGEVFKKVDGTNLNSAFNDTTNGFNATSLAKVEVPSSNPNGLVEVPAVTSIAKGDVLINDKAFVDALIAAYDDGKTGDDVFAKKKTVTNPGEENESTEMWLTVNNAGEETESYTISADGQKALYDILKEDNFANAKKYMLAKGTDEKITQKLYNEVYARAKALYINAYNTKLASADADLDLVNWVLEDIAGDSGTNAKGQTVYPKSSGVAVFWGKAKATATADSAIKTATGHSTVITNTKAAGKFNATAYLKAVSKNYTPAKSETKPKTGEVYFTQGIYVVPASPSKFTSKSLTPPTAKAGSGIALATATGYTAGTAGEVPAYTLTLEVGKSTKIPFTLEDGAEKDLVYEVGAGSSGFTVVNGKITATDANNVTLANAADIRTAATDVTTDNDANIIKVYSRTTPSVYALVQVKVDASVKSVQASAKSLAVWPGSVQTVSLGTVPASNKGDYTYKVTPPATVDVEYLAADGTTWTPVPSDGKIVGNLIKVKAKTSEGSKVAIGKTDKITVDLLNAAGTDRADAKLKAIDIKLVDATAPQDVKSVKTSVKSKETDSNNHKIINIPVGGAYNVGYTVSPATANVTVIGEVAGGATASGLTVSGDVIYAGNTVGTADVTFSLDGTAKIADAYKSNEAEANGTVTYKVNVYDPGSTITLTDDNYTIKGGFLMTADAAATDCDKTFKAGSPFAMAIPKTALTGVGNGEGIEWTANSPSAVKFEEHTIDTNNNDDVSTGLYKGFANGDKVLVITPCQTGTFTITGTTKYTKQKISFKMLVDATNTGSATDNGTVSFSGGKSISDAAVGAAVTMNVGDKINAYYASGTADVGGLVTFELKNAADKDKLTVSKTGLFTAKGAGEVTVIAKMTKADKTTEICKKEITVTINAATIGLKDGAIVEGITASTNTSDAKGAKVSAVLKNFDKKTMTLVWYTIKSGSTDKVPYTDLLDKLSGNIKLAAAGDYEVYVQPMKQGKNNVEIDTDRIGSAIKVANVRVYANAVKSANTDNGDKDTKTAIANLGKKPTETATTLGAGYGTYYIPVFVSGAEVAPDAAKVDDVVFNVSNKSLATPTFIPKGTADYNTAVDALDDGDQENDIVKGYADACGFIKIVVPNNGLSGAVTVKATLLNANKAVTIKLNVTGAAKAVDMAYAPQTLANFTNSTGANLAKVVKAPADAAKKTYVYNADSTSDFTKYAETLAANKTINVYKYVLVNGSDIKEINKDLTNNVKELDASKLTFGTEDSTTKITNVKTSESISASGTWYLAYASDVYKVKTAKSDTATLELEQAANKLKVVAICSKTPIKGSATTLSQDTVLTYSEITNNSGTNTKQIMGDVQRKLATGDYKFSTSKENYIHNDKFSDEKVITDGQNVKQISFKYNDTSLQATSTDEVVVYVFDSTGTTYKGVKVVISKVIV